MSDSLRASVPVPVEYPSSDGQPMAETSVHRECIVDTIGTARGLFAERPDVYVSGDMFVYYEEGNPRASVVPDVFVVVGAVKDELREGGWRDTYKLWEEPKGPDFVLEVTSRSTRRQDQVGKRALYARLGVGEYFLYDPRGEYLAPALQGMRLRGGEYERLSPERLPDGREGVWSEVFGLYLCRRGQALRLHDPVTGQDLRTPGEEAAAGREEAAARQAAEARAAEEATARQAAEARAAEETAARQAAEVRAAEETAARQAAEVRVAEEAAARREEAAARREEATARRAAEARIAELEALLSSGGVSASPPAPSHK